MASDTSRLGSRRVPKLGHKKSMFGCQRCRARRVKCNEAKPICHNCDRHGLPCIYDRDASAKTPQRSPPTEIPHTEPEEDDPPEDRTRRMLETRLMHQYLVETGPSIAADELTRDLFGRLVPKLSFDSDALLYSIYTLAALHLVKLGREDEVVGGAEKVASQYFSMTVREHNREISQISKETTDILCLTSSMIRCIAVVQLQGRSRVPYTSPWQWMVIIQTSVSTFIEAWKRVGPDPTSVAFRLMAATHHMRDNEKMPDTKKYQRLQHLLDHPRGPREAEDWDLETQDTYDRTVAFLCSILDLIDEEGDSSKVLRMLLLFPMLVSSRFTELVKEESPRVLVILAHYFALTVRFSDIWWVGNSGTDEVRGIATILPSEWQGLLSWPLSIIEKN
ncbi:hypothetical protein M426DRAFT_319330 [Hypoxylon sp. CI-4A]|nr:hypothetical protein M426DRAFT_319330 [Hypoxylon sp. CI-4A]